MSTRTKWIAASSSALVIIAAVVAILLTTGGKAKIGCIDTFLPGPIGAQSFDQCGPAARRTCATIKGSTQYGTAGVKIVESACRAGRLPVG